MTRKKTFIKTLTGILVIITIFIFFVFLKTSFTFSKISAGIPNANDAPTYLLPVLEDLPQNDKEQITFLLLGQRGEKEPFGGLLTDTIMLANINKTNGKVSLISIPRDMYVPLLGSKDKRDKLNAVYAWGYERGGVSTGIANIKNTVSRITGLYVDNAIIVNFDAIKDLINAIGGITINLKKQFVEDKQWWCDENGKNCKPFIVPAGENNLNGETTLFYMRSRFSSSDFDRARRQQQVIIAIKKKLFSLGFLKNPLNILKLLDVVKDNVRMDLSISDIKSLINFYQNSGIDLNHISTFVFDNGPNGYLDAKYINGQYILIPKTGSFNKIKEKCHQLIQ